MRDRTLCGTYIRNEGIVVAKFRCFCLTGDDRIAWGLHIEARDLEAAIQAAHRACQEHLNSLSSRIEIWQGSQKLYDSPKIDTSH